MLNKQRYNNCNFMIIGTTACNNLSELCELRFNQVSFVGTHNSGSGFDGRLRRCDGEMVDSCIWRNQDLNITAQLNLGVRFLEIDLCLLQEDCNSTVYGDTGNSSLFTCYARHNVFSYAGPVARLFQQVNDWMICNPQEVIGLYFPNEVPDGQKTEIISELKIILERMWFHSNKNTSGDSSVYMSTHYNTQGEWPTLSQAILSNERIFVFIDSNLTSGEHTSGMLWNHPSIFSTYIKPNQDNNECNDRLLDLADRCNTTEDILIEAGVTLGICIFTGQDNCNVILPNATLKCYNRRIGKTVNVVAVDFPELGTSTVFDIVALLNRNNIDMYRPSPVVTATTSLETLSTLASFNITYRSSPVTATTLESTSTLASSAAFNILSFKLMSIVCLVFFLSYS